MKLSLYQVDAFAEQLFAGNPAAVVPLDTWLDDALLQAIAAENNLSETAFFVPADDGFKLRWFTPNGEVDMCGHATLASAYVLYEKLAYARAEIFFYTRSGRLVVGRQGDELSMVFPRVAVEPCSTPLALTQGLGKAPRVTLYGMDYIAVYDEEEDIRSLKPDFSALQTLAYRGVVATAPGRDVDFVSRCFYPKYGVDEDPVTGSAHCALAPYWYTQLNRRLLKARQLSKRGGTVICEVNDSQEVILKGRAVHYMTAEITVHNTSSSDL